MKKQHFNLFSLSLAVALLMSLTAGYVKAQPQVPTPNPGHEPLVIKQQKELDIAICAPGAGPFSLNFTNPYFPLSVGNTWVLEKVEQGAKIRVQITVLNETVEVAGVPTRVVEEREWEDDQLIEVSRNFFVQAEDKTVCYYGEDVDIYDENGEVVAHDGQWRAGENDALPGIIMPGDPKVGMTYAQEVAPGVAEDQAEIVSIGKTVTVPVDTFRDTLRTRETTPLEPDAESFKVYAPGVGLIVDDKAKLVEVNLREDDDDD